MRSTIARIFAGLVCTWAFAATAESQVRIVVPFSPGGGLDAMGRVLAQKLQEQTGETYLIDNRPGATGLIGAKFVANAPPDGLTWLFQDSTSLTVNSILRPDDAGFHEQKNLVTVGALGYLPSVLVVNPAWGVKNLQEFVAAGKKEDVTFGSGGTGSLGHLTMEYFASVAGLSVRHIAYKGGAPAMTDLLGGQIKAAFVAIPVALPHIKSGKLVPLAVSSLHRAQQLPDVPTASEAGFPGFEVGAVYFMMLPKGVPADVSKSIADKLQRMLADPAAREQIRAVGVEPTERMTDAAAWLDKERKKWSQLINVRGIQAQ